ncbi:MAG: mycothiol system anti-sigma-R factor [Geodermatophilaceae bacterium]|nr:mycothiol system anti-sigma-R factor [Geodermatophilaceae bacterium]
MSCGKPHEVPCDEVLHKVFLFLDSECDQLSRTHIAQHLDECGPCLQYFGIEREIKALIHRKCGGDPAPEGLRERVRIRLRLVAVEQGYLEIPER